MPAKPTRKVSHGVVVNSTTVSVHPSQLPDIYRPPSDRDLQILLDKAVSEDEWVMVFKKALEMSLAGGMAGVKYMEFLARYRFGLPAMMTISSDNAQANITIVEVIRPQAQSEDKPDSVQPEPPPIEEPKIADKTTEQIAGEEDTVPF